VLGEVRVEVGHRARASSFGHACLDAIDNPSSMEKGCVYQPADLDCTSSGKNTLVCVCAK
jgi:hypothetical protein